jgi:hypothetical protein
MIDAHVQPDAEQLRVLTRYMRNAERQLPRFVGAALRRTVTNVRVQVVNAVHQDLNVQKQKLFQAGNPRRPIRESITRGPTGHPIAGRVIAESGSSPDAPTTSAKGRAGRIPLGRFGARALARRRGVTYQIERGAGRQAIPEAFMMRMRSGYAGVFRWIGGKSVELYGPSVGHVAERRPQIRQLLSGAAAALLEKNMGHQIQRLLAQPGGKA